MPEPYKFIGGNKNYTLTITIVNPKQWDMWEGVESIFMENFKTLFKYAVYDANRYLIRITPMLTGRLRGGWTSFLDKHNEDYTAAFADVSLVEGHSEPLSNEAIEEGKALSTFEETDFVVSLMNAVEYADYVDSGTSVMDARNFTAKALYKFEFILKRYLEQWDTKCSEEGVISSPEHLEEVQA